MSTQPDVIQELRAMFKEGATPSRLIKHIADRHEGVARLHGLIQEYFIEAFAVPIVRGLDPIADYRFMDPRLAYLNEDLVHEIIEKRSEWDRDHDSLNNGEISWLDSAKARSDEERFQAAQAGVVPELSQCWQKLSPKEQQYIQRTFASANGLYESVKILARLADRLQRRVVELEETVLQAQE